MTSEVNSETGRGEKSRYEKPVLVRYGSVRALTQAGYSGNPEQGQGCPSSHPPTFSTHCD